MVPEDTLQELNDKADDIMTAIRNYTEYAVASGHNSAGAHARRAAIRSLIVNVQKIAYLHGLDDGIKTVKFVT